MTFGGVTTSTFRASPNIAHVAPGPTAGLDREIERRRAAGDDIIDFSGLTYDVAAPRCAVEIASHTPADRRAAAGADRLELRAAAARYLSLLSGGRPVNADLLVPSPGAAPALYQSCLALFGPGDRVLVPTPTWPGYATHVYLARAIPVPVAGDIEWSLKVGLGDLDRAADARTAGVVLSTPVNPTGAVYTRTELQGIVEWAAERGAWVILDESRRLVHYGTGPCPSALDLPDDLLEHVIVVSGVRAIVGELGWRVAFTVAPRGAAAALSRLDAILGGGIPGPVERAIAQILTDPRLAADLERAVADLRSRRDAIVEHFRAELGGVEFVEPLGGHHFFFRVDGFFGDEVASALQLCERALAEEGVALAPGERFGEPRWVRLSYAAPERDVRRGLARLTVYLRSLERR